MSPLPMNSRMSSANKDLLSKRFREYKDEISTEPTRRKLNDHALLIDGLNTFIRAFSINPSLNEDGSHVGGLIGFLKSVRFAVNKFKPTRCVIVFDGKHGSKSRQKIYPNYKGGRKVRSRLNRVVDWTINPHDESEAMKLQLSRLVEYIENLPLTILSIDGLEADDVIAYATNTALKDSKITIMSTDKDFYQLVSDRVELYSPTKKITYDEELVRKEFGIYPQNVLTCRVIDGDRSDDIPGVRGVGTKSLVKEYPELSENKPFDIKTLLDAAEKKSTRISKMIVENELVIKRNYLLMQLKEPNINNHAKLRITDAIRDLKPQIVKYNLQRLLVQDKLWGQIPNFDNWVVEFMELNHYWNNQ